MNVVFDAERLRNPNSGLGQLCRALGSALVDARPPGSTISFVVPPSQRGTFGLGVRDVPTAWWQRFRAPLDADVWHAAHQDVWIRPPRGARMVLSIMDLNFLERAEYSDAKKARRLAAVQRKVDGAAAIATISEFTASVVRRHLRVDGVPLRVVHLGSPMDLTTPEPAGPSSVALRGLSSRSFFVFVGVIHPKKNVHTLLPILRAMPSMTLVLAGPATHAYAVEVREEASRLGVGDRVVIPGPVDEPTKRWLYTHGRALLFPSLSEGFGLPVVEAMSVGTPVFLSRLTSLPEIGGSVAYYFDSFEPESMVETVRRGLEDFDSHPGRAELLRAHAARFSWPAAAMAYWSLYDEVRRFPRR